jgi:hypothetical protein
VRCGVQWEHIQHNQKFKNEKYLVVDQEQVAMVSIYGKQLV